MSSALKVLLGVSLASVLWATGEPKPLVTGTYWSDTSGNFHANGQISLKSLRSFGINGEKFREEKRDTRVKVVQAWGCMVLAKRVKHTVTGDRSVTIEFGEMQSIAPYLMYSPDTTDSVQVLGSPGCEEIGNVESWTVEQKTGGAWSVVATGQFFFSE